MKLLTTNQAAEVLQIPAGTLRYWRNVGVGPVWLKLEGTIRYDEADLETYLRASRRIPSVRAIVEEKRVSL